jgi:hypothetical protein
LKGAAPWGLRDIVDEGVFTERYLARLDTIGIDAFRQRFAEISDRYDGRGLVFLCYEPVGEPCHRHLFARWIEEQTGQPVSELFSREGRGAHEIE